MPRPERGGGLPILWVPLVGLAIVVLGQVSLEPDRPPAELGTLDLEVVGSSWTSEPIVTDATALGISWEGASQSRRAWVRAGAGEEEQWGPWTEIHPVEGHGPDRRAEGSGGGAEMSEAVYVGEAQRLQFRVTGDPGPLEVVYVDTTGRGRSLLERIEAWAGRIRFAADAAAASPDAPAIMPRSAWGGDQCVAANPEFEVGYIDRVQAMFVHHTIHSAAANTYGPSNVADLLYAICSFHVVGQQWNDIAYNVVIDKYGTVWEGRAGGVDQSIRGAHTAGFNSYSTGVAFLGDHRWSAPSPAAQDAFVRYATWKLDVHHIDPASVVTLESLGSTVWPEGTEVPVRAIAGHRDVGTTSCPGDGVLSLLDGWAAQAAASGGAKIFGGWPQDEPIKGLEATGYTPTAFSFRMTEEMNWTLSVRDLSGSELLSQAGAGTEGRVPWDGIYDGAPLPFGDYVVRIEAIPVSGAPPPRPAEFTFQLGSFDPPFADDDGSVHEQDIGVIHELGITTGCDVDLFCPGQELTRWQMALFLSRLHGAIGGESPDPTVGSFDDITQLPADRQKAVELLGALGITRGTEPRIFDPDGLVTRRQMALFLTRHLAALGRPLPPGAESGFQDIGNLDDESRLAIEQLALLRISRGTGVGVFEPESLVTRAQMASFLARMLAIVQVPTQPG